MTRLKGAMAVVAVKCRGASWWALALAATLAACGRDGDDVLPAAATAAPLLSPEPVPGPEYKITSKAIDANEEAALSAALRRSYDEATFAALRKAGASVAFIGKVEKVQPEQARSDTYPVRYSVEHTLVGTVAANQVTVFHPRFTASIPLDGPIDPRPGERYAVLASPLQGKGPVLRLAPGPALLSEVGAGSFHAPGWADPVTTDDIIANLDSGKK